MSRRFMHSAAKTLIAGMFVAGFAQETCAQVPAINLEETCRAASAVMVDLMGRSTTQNDMQICMDSENRAREQLVKDWGTFDASDRTGCIQARVYLPSYVEWLTCFDMNKVAREARNTRGIPDTNPNAPVAMPRMRRGGGY
jgi:hypothetical protein